MNQKIALDLKVNGRNRLIYIHPTEILLFVLREHLGYTGAKPGCLNGDCGACTVLINERPIKSCMCLAVEAIEQEVLTIEGLQDSKIQQAFVEEFAFQCGYCTSGFIMNCHSLISHHVNAEEDLIKEWLSSNICRCTGYYEIERAVKKVLK